MLRKQISIILAVIVLLSLVMIGVQVEGAPAYRMQIKVIADKTEVNTGDTVNFKVVLGPVSEVGSIIMAIYIPSGLTYVAGSGKIASGAKETMGFTYLDWEEKTLMIDGYAEGYDYESTADLTLATFQCAVDRDAYGCDFSVSVDHLEIVSCETFENFTDLFDITSTTVKVTEYVAPTTQPATPDQPTTNPESKCTIRFDATTAGWENASNIQFYIFEIDGSELHAWGSKRNRGTKGNNGVWFYDAAEAGVVKGKQYALILYNEDTLMETYQLLFDTSCNGDTAYCTGNKIENPVDSNKTSLEARWRNSSLGPRLAITSIGNVVGDTCPANTTRYDMLLTFLVSDGKDGLKNAMNFAEGRTQDEIINSVGRKLGLSDSDINRAKSEAGISSGATHDQSPTVAPTVAPTASVNGCTVRGYFTSYLDSKGTVTIQLINSKGKVKYATSVTGNEGSYSIYGVEKDSYTLRVSKDDHVDRDYSLKVVGNTSQDVQICPLGDVTMDGQVTTMDVTRANAHVKGKATLEGYALECADVLPNTAGITTMDVTRINSHVQKARPLW